VTGVVSPDAVWSNAGARAGDVLLLTKPVGTGVVATAVKFERAPEAAAAAATAVMLELNKRAAEALQTLPAASVHACTDVTGFGLLGHASEMAEASRVTLRLQASAVPLIEGALDLAANRSGGMKTNEQHFGPGVRVEGQVAPNLLAILYDPQTSGGLLAAVDPTHAAAALAALTSSGVSAARVGVVEAPSGPAIVLT
jgi:selenide,water dikinase